MTDRGSAVQVQPVIERHFEPATSEEYAGALLEVEARLGPKNLAALRLQYAAPERMVTAPEIAVEVGYRDHRPANALYGSLGRHVAGALGRRPDGQTETDKRWWAVLSAGHPRTAGLGFRWQMHAELAAALEVLGWVRPSDAAMPEEVPPPEHDEMNGTGLVEGRARRVWVNAYERSGAARARCIEHYGLACAACGLDFGERYGPAASGLIHVHHEVPLSDIGEEYEVDPVADLKPVCPNCHAVIHRRSPPFSIEEVKRMLPRQAEWPQRDRQNGRSEAA